MLNRKKLLFLLLVFTLVSCSTSRIENEALYTAIKEIKTPFSSRNIDSIEIVEHSFKMDERRFKGYKIDKEIALNHRIFPSGENYEWVDKKYISIIEDSEIDSMIIELNKQHNIFWSTSKNNKYNLIVNFVELPMFEDKMMENAERQKRMKTEKFVYYFSKPVFNKKKDIFFIEYEAMLLPYSKKTLAFRKENGKWNKIVSLSQPW